MCDYFYSEGVAGIGACVSHCLNYISEMVAEGDDSINPFTTHDALRHSQA